jgi:hypothetical protein
MGNIAKTIRDLYDILVEDSKFLTIHRSGDIELLLLNDVRAEEPSKITIKLSLASSAYYHVHTDKDGDFGPYDYLQFYSRLHRPVTDHNLQNIRKQLLELNAQLPLIGFGLESENGIRHLHFRYMMLIARNRMEVSLVKRALELIFFLIGEYEPTFHASPQHSKLDPSS